MKFLDEFKAFAMRGNVVDLAVGVIIGAAFNRIVSSLVDGIFMPVIGLLSGGVNIADKKFTIGQASIKWGASLQSIIEFLIVAFCLFLIIKGINLLRKAEEKEPAKTSEEVKVLEEIRDVLKKIEEKP